MSLFDRFKKSKEAKEETLKKATAAVAPKAGKKAAKDDKATAKASKSDKSEKKAAKAEQKAVKSAMPSVVPTAHQVLIRPIVTEKATISGTYYFEVAKDSNKAEIRKAIRQLYGVTPVHVRVMNVQGKAVRWNYQLGQRSDWKKAIVRLKAGETINVYEGT